MNRDTRADERFMMVESQIACRGIKNPRVLAAMRQVPRHLFIPPPYDSSAYEDCPLPIGNGQTISQPYIVALMTDLLDPGPDDRILEIGAGSGYQAAILAALAKNVITIERIPAVAELARSNLIKLGITNARLVVGDGTIGYPEYAPYNGILITAATPQIPQPLIDQIADGGRLIAPVGGRDIQELVRISRIQNKTVETYHGGVRFVPLIGTYGWSGDNS
jgi:protein-L-isoaspartate(D-aspartate) O-methyltransferase